MSQVHPCARTTPRARAEINASPAGIAELADLYNITVVTLPLNCVSHNRVHELACLTSHSLSNCIGLTYASVECSRALLYQSNHAMVSSLA